MANKLGAAFLRCALGPLHYAGGCILSGKVLDGLRELSADSLHGGFRRGLDEAAQQVGVRVPDIERLLPMVDVQTAVARLDNAQRDAVLAWETYAGHIGGLLKGVADLTVDGRAPDVSMFLERLSKKVVRDAALSEPLHTLGGAVAAWLDLVEQCGELLADGGVLAEAYRARRRKRILSGVGVAAVAAGALSVELWIRSARVRVDALLDTPDPCAALSISQADLSRASSEQAQRAGDRRTACEERRQRDESVREEERRRELEGRLTEVRRKEREDRCQGLAERLAGGAVLPEDEELAPGKGSLLQRIANKSLNRGDMTEQDLPCADSKAAPRIAAAFTAAVVASPGAWANADDRSDRVVTALVDHAEELPRAAKQQIQVHADELVRQAIIQKSAAATARAERACKLREDMGVRGSKYCPGLPSLKAQGKL